MKKVLSNAEIECLGSEIINHYFRGEQYNREWVDIACDMGIGSWITSALESNIGLNAIAQLCSDIYGNHIKMPQGLGTGQLFTDNIPMPLEIRGDQLWRVAHSLIDNG